MLCYHKTAEATRQLGYMKDDDMIQWKQTDIARIWYGDLPDGRRVWLTPTRITDDYHRGCKINLAKNSTVRYSTPLVSEPMWVNDAKAYVERWCAGISKRIEAEKVIENRDSQESGWCKIKSYDGKSISWHKQMLGGRFLIQEIDKNYITTFTNAHEKLGREVSRTKKGFPRAKKDAIRWYNSPVRTKGAELYIANHFKFGDFEALDRLLQKFSIRRVNSLTNPHRHLYFDDLHKLVQHLDTSGSTELAIFLIQGLGYDVVQPSGRGIHSTQGYIDIDSKTCHCG